MMEGNNNFNYSSAACSSGKMRTIVPFPRESPKRNVERTCNYFNNKGSEKKVDQIELNTNVDDGKNSAIYFDLGKPTFTTELSTQQKIDDHNFNDCKELRDLSVLEKNVDKLNFSVTNNECKAANNYECKMDQFQLPPYPCHGIIKKAGTLYSDFSIGKEHFMNVDNKQSDSTESKIKQVSSLPEEFVGKLTSDLYPISENLPRRFNHPEWFEGYGCEKSTHPFYLTTSYEYGRFPPNPHTMARTYFPITCKFTEHLARTGMPRNRSLNLVSNKSYF